MTRLDSHLRADRLLGLLTALLMVLFSATAAAQPEEEPEDPPEDQPTPPEVSPIRVNPGGQAPGSSPIDFGGALQIMRAPGPDAGPSGVVGKITEIFPDATKVYLSIRDIDPVPVETARRGGPWLCSGGKCGTESKAMGASSIGNRMLRSIKLQTPALPVPVSIFARGEGDKGVLLFDPKLMGQRHFGHICSYKPIEGEGGAAPGKADKVRACSDTQPRPNEPDTAELTLGMQWPDASEIADFRYLAIVDSCGNARVQPFRRSFTVPVIEVVSGGCGKPDGKVLRIFPHGSFVRVTAFNLQAPAVGNVVNVTYRVEVPALEDPAASEPARLLFPDIAKDLRVDCGPRLLKAAPDARGIPQAPPGARPPGAAPPGAVPPGAAPPGAKPPAAPGAPPAGTPMQSPPPAVAGVLPASRPSGQLMDHRSLLIAPEPFRQGNCRIRLAGQLKGRLVAPLALRVTLDRTDVIGPQGKPVSLLVPSNWVITPSDSEFLIPPVNFDGESRIRLAVYSDPLSPNGKVTLISDAGRVGIALRASLMNDESQRRGSRRLMGSVTIHTAPLCGEDNFETLDAAGSCLRAYLTIPAMLASLQITRAPWVEKPLITRTVLNSVGVALAFDSYDPVARKAFPIAAQVGGFVQTLGEDRLGLLAYVGIAPTLPVLGQGGNTTSFGFLAGVGLNYLISEKGGAPDEGLKPAAFLSFVVQVGQATPSYSDTSTFGSYSSTTVSESSSSKTSYSSSVEYGSPQYDD